MSCTSERIRVAPMLKIFTINMSTAPLCIMVKKAFHEEKAIHVNNLIGAEKSVHTRSALAPALSVNNQKRSY